MQIKRLTDIFGNLCYALEALYVINGIKKVTRLRFHESQTGKLRLIGHFLKEHGLKAEVSTHKYVAIPEACGIYQSSYSVPEKRGCGKKGFLYLYISRLKKICALAKFSEEYQYDDVFGDILGYPGCCIKFYTANIQRYFKAKRDLIYGTLEATRIDFPYPFWNNFAARYFDVTLLSHFPCSFSCDKSIAIARERLDLIRSISPRTARDIARELKSVVIATTGRGIYKINDFLLEGKRISAQAQSLSCINRSDIGDLIAKNPEMIVNGKSSLKFAGNNTIVKSEGGNDVGVFIFR